ncbi:uncharacterized protein LOC142007155 [Carettochelys insculpta]|uniref:uncharacterized protein LOC142007155 n=1 Tax=Carettochelys insculpta TaxID=44489 RepID=UPI003EB93974
MGAGSTDGGLLGGPSGLSGVAGGGRHDAGTATFYPDDSMAPQLLVIFLTTSLTSATPKHPLRNAIQSIVSTAGATDCWMCTLLNSSTRLGIEFVPLNLNDWWDKSNIFQWGPFWFDDSNVHSYLRRGPWGSCCDRMESETLAMSRSILQQLQDACQVLVSSIQGLPTSLQDKVQQVYRNMEELRASFSTVGSFQDLSSSPLTQSREMVSRAQEYVDELMAYMMQNAPLSWIVGPFIPSGKGSAGSMEPPSQENEDKEAEVTTASKAD